MIIILFILYAVLFAAYEVSIKNDWRYNGYQLFHALKFALNLYILAGLMFLPLPENPVLFGLTAGTVFWTVFDISYNLFNNQKWYHFGGSGMDKLGYWQFVIKICLISLILWLW